MKDAVLCIIQAMD